MKFFTSPEDLEEWVSSQGSSDEAARKIIEVAGKGSEQDIVDTCRSVYEKEDNNASKVLFSILSQYNITQTREGKMKKDTLKKEAQIYRGEAPLYQSMPLRICPKLARNGVVSTIHCREYCQDSIVLDDDPQRVYCAETLWRRHLMDKFSREFKNKDGKWVGGYINERFQIFHDDGGNQMELANNERTRKPRPHQYSVERRMSEARGEETYDITVSSNKKVIKLASVEKEEEVDPIYQIFDDIVEMKEAGVGNEDIIYKVAEHYNKSIIEVASVHKIAIKQLKKHDKVVYAHDSSKMQKIAQFPERSTMVSKKDLQIVTVADGKPTTLKIETPVVVVSNANDRPVFEIVDGPDAGKQFHLSNSLDINESFGVVEDTAQGMMQDTAEEVGLNEESIVSPNQPSDFPVVDVS